MKRICQNCEREAISACLCTNPPLLLCGVHNHNRLSSTMHRSVNIYSKIPTESCHLAQSICYSALTQLKSSQKHYLDFFSKLILLIKKESKKLNNEFRQKASQLQRMILYLNTYDYILTNVEMSREEQELSSLLTTGVLDLPTFPDFDEIIDSIKLNFQNFNNLGNSRDRRRSDNRRHSENDRRSGNQRNSDIERLNAGSGNRKLILPMPYKNSVFIFDVEDFKVDSMTFNTQEFTCGYGFALLPGNELMIYGGAVNIETKKPLKFLMSSESILMNPFNKTFKKLREGLPKSDTGNGAYLDGHVYVFGGLDQDCNNLNSAMKYDCNNDRWVYISNLPEPFGDCSSALYNRDIFISNKKSELIHIYNAPSNTYLESMKFKAGNKVLLAIPQGLFLLISNDILLYKSEWLFAGTTNIEMNSMISPYIERKGYIYFITGKFNFVNGSLAEPKILRFNTNSYTMELIRDKIAIN